MTFTDADAQRLLRIVDERIERRLSQTQVRYLWGTVASVDSTNKKCSVYILGDGTASDGFRFEAMRAPGVGQVVLVSISPDGDRWIEKNASAVQLGDGNSLWNGSALELRTNGGSQYIDFANDTSTDYDARIIYSPALYDEYLRIMGKDLRATGNVYIDGKITEVLSSGSRFRTGSGINAGVASDAAKAIEVYNPSTTTGDAFITFHNPNRYAVHFGLDGSTNELFVGGWSAGAAKSKIWTGANSTPPYQIRFGAANMTCTAGASNSSAAVTWGAMVSAPDIVIVQQTSLPGGSGQVTEKTAASTWSATGATIYLYPSSGGTFPSTMTIELRYVALKFI